MEIVKKLNVPASFFYDKVVDSALFDIRKQTGKKITAKQLRTFEYVKEFSKTSSAKIKVEKLVENQSYHFRTSTTKNDYLVKYDIVEIDDKSCELHYSETMKSFGLIQNMNDMLMSILLGFFKKKRFSKMIDMIEASY